MYPLLSMFIFSLTMSISPGPVNLVIVSSGANHGARSTFPFVSGATLGFTALLVFVGMSMQSVITDHPAAFAVVELAGSAFITYMGYKIATAPTEISLGKEKAPTFTQGWLMQWLNPKAWIACVSGVTLFSVPASNAALHTFFAIYFVTCYLSLFAWCLLGERLTTVLDSAGRLRAFNLITGGMLITSTLWMLGSRHL